MIRRPPRSTLFPTRRSSDLQVHRVEHLLSHQALVQRARELDQAVGQGRLPMVDMGHNTEVADVILAHVRSEEHTSELQSRLHLVCRLLLEKKKNRTSY